MPTQRFILTRHPGAAAWIRSRIRIDQEFSHLEDLSGFQPGDEVYGVFPLHLAAWLCARGVRCFHIEFNLPEHLRGQEITLEQMEQMEVKLNEYMVIRAGCRPSDSKELAHDELLPDLALNE